MPDWIEITCAERDQLKSERDLVPVSSGVTPELPAAPRYSGPVVDLDGAH